MAVMQSAEYQHFYKLFYNLFDSTKKEIMICVH